VPFQRPCPADGNAGNFANFQYDIQYFNKLYSDQTKGDATRSVPLRAGSRRVDHVSYDGVEQGTRGEARRYHCSDFFVPKPHVANAGGTVAHACTRIGLEIQKEGVNFYPI
jgi:hypothetical protein